MHELLSFLVGLTGWIVVGWGAYRIYRAVAGRIPALDRAVNRRASALRRAATPGPGTTRLGLAYLWALGNYHLRYRSATNELPATSEEPRYLDAA